MILTAGMAHPRKLIRHAMVDLLKAANTAVGVRVFPTRVEPYKTSLLPAISVYTLADASEDGAQTSTTEPHEVDVEVAAWVAHSDANPADDAMDDLAEQIEKAVHRDPRLGGKAYEEVRLRGTVMELAAVDGRSDPNVGIAVLTFSVRYLSDLTQGEATDDFVTAHAETELVGGVDDTEPAQDTFPVQEP